MPFCTCPPPLSRLIAPAFLNPPHSFTASRSSSLPRHVEPILQRVELALGLLAEALSLVRLDGAAVMPLVRVAMITLTAEGLQPTWQVKAAGEGERGNGEREGEIRNMGFTLISPHIPSGKVGKNLDA